MSSLCQSPVFGRGFFLRGYRMPPDLLRLRLPCAGGCGIKHGTGGAALPTTCIPRRGYMRNKTPCFCVALPCSLPMAAFAQSTPVGKWKTIDDKTGKPKSIVEIYRPTNGTLAGKVLQVLESDKGPHPVCDKCDGEQEQADQRHGDPVGPEARRRRLGRRQRSSTRRTARSTRSSCRLSADGKNWKSAAASASRCWAAARPGCANRNRRALRSTIDGPALPGRLFSRGRANMPARKAPQDRMR